MRTEENLEGKRGDPRGCRSRRVPWREEGFCPTRSDHPGRVQRWCQHLGTALDRGRGPSQPLSPCALSPAERAEPCGARGEGCRTERDAGDSDVPVGYREGEKNPGARRFLALQNPARRAQGQSITKAAFTAGQLGVFLRKEKRTAAGLGCTRPGSLNFF